jgi:uncharacterized protein YcbK (DUF882 family)
VGDLSEHFDRWEFACKGIGCCGRSAPINDRLIEDLEELIKIVDLNGGGEHHAMRINSGFRCLTHNRMIGSDDRSFHTLGMAADITVEGFCPERVAKMALGVYDFVDGGIGIYPGFVHLDIRKTGKARW